MKQVRKKSERSTCSHLTERKNNISAQKNNVFCKYCYKTFIYIHVYVISDMLNCISMNIFCYFPKLLPLFQDCSSS